MNFFLLMLMLFSLQLQNATSLCTDHKRDCSNHGICVDGECVCETGYYTSATSAYECNRDVPSSNPKKLSDGEANILAILAIIIYVLTVIVQFITKIFTISLILILLLWCCGFISNEKMLKLFKIYLLILIFAYILGSLV